MKLPNPDRAIVNISKLRDYCLNPDHPRGQHKARVFKASLGWDSSKAPELREALLAAAREAVARSVEQDEYGQRYVVDFVVPGPGGDVTIRSSWIVRRDEDFPRFTSCYVV